MAAKIAELDNGVVIYQITDTPMMKDNIYCERSYCSPDSRWFVYQRQPDGEQPRSWIPPWEQPPTVEYMACEFGSWRTRTLAQGLHYPEISSDGLLYHQRISRDGAVELASIRIDTGESRAFQIDGGMPPVSGLSISRDGCFLAHGVVISYAPQMFGIAWVDLRKGTSRIICTDPYIANPHPQIETTEGKVIMVQQNRGCVMSPEGRFLKPAGPEGPTLVLVRVSDGQIIPLQVGKPHTWDITGHEQWRPGTKEMIFSVGAWARPGVAIGKLLSVREGEPARVISDSFRFSHVHVSSCGRFYCSDVLETGNIIVGSLVSGKGVVIYCVGTRNAEICARYGQSSHIHPYLSPDLRWVVFNSCRTGRPEIHVASLPNGLLASL